MTTIGGSPFDSAWYLDTIAAASQRPRLTSELDVDVCVVGGGLAGLTVAREVARRGRSVAVLEAKRIASGASGRNGGVVRPGFPESVDNIVRRVGLRRARELCALSVRGVEYVRAAAQEPGIAGVDPVEGFLGVSRIDQGARLLRHADMLQELFGVDVELWPSDRVREVLHTERYSQALHWPRAFHINPLNYALGLAAAAERSGARILEDTPALALDISGDRKRVDTSEGRVHARHVVLAGGALLGPLLPILAGTMLPITAHLAVTAPLGERLGEAVRFPGTVAEGRLSSNQYRVVEGTRLLWGAGASVGRSGRIAPAIAGRIRKVFPQLGRVDVAQVWSDVIGYAVHRMPQLGHIMPGIWLVNAFGNLGLSTTAMAGELIACAMIEGDDRWRLFSGYDLVWTGGSVGTAATGAVLRATDLWERLEPAVSQSMARGRVELAHAASRAAHAAIGGVRSTMAPRGAATEMERATPEARQRMSIAAIARNAEMLHRGITKGSVSPAFPREEPAKMFATAPLAGTSSPTE